MLYLNNCIKKVKAIKGGLDEAQASNFLNNTHLPETKNSWSGQTLSMR